MEADRRFGAAVLGFDRLWRLAAVSLWGALGLAGTPTLMAQQQGSNTVTCEDCTLTWTELVRLGEGDEPGFIVNHRLAVTRDHQGRYWITYGEGELPAVYSPTGEFLAQIGRHGEGPGEFRSPTLVLPIPGDSVVIFDQSLLRASVINSDLETTRTVSVIGDYVAAAVANWPSIVANGVVATPGGFGLPYHLIDLGSTRGNILRSFGGFGRATTPKTRSNLYGHLANGTGDWFWTVPRTEYSIQKWALNTDGEAIDSVYRRPSWFREPSRWTVGSPTRSPPPLVDGLFEDSAGRIWTFLRMPRANWEAAWPELAPGTPRTGSPNPWDLWHTRVEVINPGSDEVYLRADMDDLIRSVLNDGTVAVYRESSGGLPYVSIMKCLLSENPTRSGFPPSRR